MNRNLIEVARAGLVRVDFVSFAVSRLIQGSLVLLVGVLEHPDFLLDIFLQLSLIHYLITHFTPDCPTGGLELVV